MRVIVSDQILAAHDLKACVEVLRNGGIVCYPTETFYALGVDPWNVMATNKLYRLKGRKEKKELPFIAANEQMVSQYCKTDHPKFAQLAKRFWPGPLTLVLPAISGSGNYAIRVTSHPLAAQLCKEFGAPLVSTSANKSGAPPVCMLRDLPDSIARGIDIAVEGGETPGGAPSTILSLLQEVPVILREGAIPSEILYQL